MDYSYPAQHLTQRAICSRIEINICQPRSDKCQIKHHLVYYKYIVQEKRKENSGLCAGCAKELCLLPHCYCDWCRSHLVDPSIYLFSKPPNKTPCQCNALRTNLQINTPIFYGETRETSIARARSSINRTRKKKARAKGKSGSSMLRVVSDTRLRRQGRIVPLFKLRCHLFRPQINVDRLEPALLLWHRHLHHLAARAADTRLERRQDGVVHRCLSARDADAYKALTRRLVLEDVQRPARELNPLLLDLVLCEGEVGLEDDVIRVFFFARELREVDLIAVFVFVFSS
jgi:hypothetical protein